MALMVLGTSAAEAQFVEMSGSYGETNGKIVNIPQNPPLTICGAGGNINTPPAAPGNAKCKGARTKNAGVPTAPGSVFSYAAPAFGVGVKGGHRVIPGGLLKGSTFTVPPLAFSQDLPPQGGAVVNNAVVYLTTTFDARMPGTARAVSPPANTRVMGPQGAVPIAGQTGRPTGPVVTVAMSPFGADFGSIKYTEGVNKFGGTMASLLDGTATLFIKAAFFDGFFGTPVMGTQPVGNQDGIFAERGGMGWNYPVTGTQLAGNIVGPATVNTPCTGMIPAFPANCNQPTGALSNIISSAGNFLPPANSVKFVFPWTTGTITQIVTGMRQGQTITSTLTAMGYDTTTATPGVRNVGMVAGSYTQRTAGTGMELASQITAVDLTFTPEPGATAALFAGIGLLGLAGIRARRRS